MEPVEYRQRHRDVRYDGPSPVSEEQQVRGPKLSPVLFQSVDGPHCHVGYDQEGDELPSWFAFRLLDISAASPPAIEHEHGLDAGLNETEDFG